MTRNALFLVSLKPVCEVKYLLRRWSSPSSCTCPGRASLTRVRGRPAPGCVLLLRSVPALWLGSPEKPSRKPVSTCPLPEPAGVCRHRPPRICRLAVQRSSHGRRAGPGRRGGNTQPRPSHCTHCRRPRSPGSKHEAATRSLRSKQQQGGRLRKEARIQGHQTSSVLDLPITAPGLDSRTHPVHVPPTGRTGPWGRGPPTAQVSKLRGAVGPPLLPGTARRQAGSPGTTPPGRPSAVPLSVESPACSGVLGLPSSVPRLGSWALCHPPRRTLSALQQEHWEVKKHQWWLSWLGCQPHTSRFGA